MINLASVFLGGGLGACLRYLTGKFVTKFSINPCVSTFIVNILGSFLIGFIFSYSIHKFPLNNHLKLFLTTGLMGGLTTFSTFTFEGLSFIKSGDYFSFVLYTLSSFLISLLMAFLGFELAKAI